MGELLIILDQKYNFQTRWRASAEQANHLPDIASDSMEIFFPCLVQADQFF